MKTKERERQKRHRAFLCKNDTTEKPDRITENPTQSDAVDYTTALKKKLEFNLCAVCAYEGPNEDMLARDSLEDDLGTADLNYFIKVRIR